MTLTCDRRCARCSGSMDGKRPHAVYCTRKCKTASSEQRRVRDDAARYVVEREKRLAHAAEYARRKPHVGQAIRARRKALRRNAGIFQMSARDWRRLCDRHRGECFYCGQRAQLTMDHVIPIIRGGRHSIGNIVPACLACNSSKSKRFIMEWRTARRSVTRRALETV